MAIAAGTRFNQYALVSPIGAGGMGEVYLAEDTKLKPVLISFFIFGCASVRNPTVL